MKWDKQPKSFLKKDKYYLSYTVKFVAADDLVKPETVNVITWVFHSPADGQCGMTSEYD